MPFFETVLVGAHVTKIEEDPVFNTVKPDHHYMLIEPHPDNYEKMKGLYEPKITPGHGVFLQCACSDKKGDLTLYVPERKENSPYWLEALVSSDPEHVKGHQLDEAVHPVQVKCTTLDDLFQEHDVTGVNWLWVDTEGHETEVLMGLDLTKVKPKFIAFEHRHMNGPHSLQSPVEAVRDANYMSLIDHFTEHGYVVVNINGFDTIVGFFG
jgi:FkbM family methyltransferase